VTNACAYNKGSIKTTQIQKS